MNVTGVTSACPAEPTAVSHELGATSCTITLTCPSKTLGGATIDALTGVNIYRDGELLATVTAGVAPGKTVSYEDASEVSTGVHTYSVAAVSAAGEGKRASFDAYRGLDIPGAVTNLRVWEDAKESGTIHITFDYPETGLNGGYYDRESAEWLADYTYYSTWEGEIVNLGSGNDLTYKHSAGFPSQDIFAVSVYGQNATGNGRTVRRTRSCVVGPALSLPVRESWSGGSLATIWTGQDIDDQQEAFSCYWEVRNGDVTLSAQDSDYGLFALTAAKDGVSKRALGPRISLKGASKPFMSFYYAYSTAATALDLEILVDDQPVKTIQALSVDPANAGKWQRVEVDLTPYKDSEYIEVAFGGYANEGTEAILIDNVTFADQLESDLAVVSFEGPEKVDVNSAATFALTLRNNTPNAVKAADYTIDLYKNGALLGQYKGVDLAGEARVSASLQDTPIVTDPALCEYFVELNFIDDQDKSNNKSSAVSVRVVGNDYPTVTDLQGSYDAARGVVLSWSDPSTASLPRVPSTESWESLTCYSISEFGDWTVFDGDGAKTVTPGTVFGSLNYEHVGEPMAWQVIDTNESYLYFWSSAFEARTGSKLLSSFQASGTACLDYLISPELAGDAQTISFYAACASPALGGNVFMVMTSSTDNEPSSFTALATDQTVSEKSWTEYRYELPAGTRYFAIVNVSTGQAAMLIDDVTFAGVNSAALSLELQGFNVYRDGQRLNSDLVAENEYVDATVEAGKSYTYHVTPLWDKGEAPVSNAATVAAESGISSVGAQEAPVEYYDLRGCRVRGQLTPGIYIRRQGAVATKILVK